MTPESLNGFDAKHGVLSGSERISGCFFTISATSLQTNAARSMRIKTEISHTVTLRSLGTWMTLTSTFMFMADTWWSALVHLE